VNCSKEYENPEEAIKMLKNIVNGMMGRL